MKPMLLTKLYRTCLEVALPRPDNILVTLRPFPITLDSIFMLPIYIIIAFLWLAIFLFIIKWNKLIPFIWTNIIIVLFSLGASYYLYSHSDSMFFDYWFHFAIFLIPHTLIVLFFSIVMYVRQNKQ